MAKSQPKLLGFNGGVISPLALARQDLPKYAIHAEEQTNIIPRHMGSAMLRPGLEYILEADDQYPSYNFSIQIPFIFSASDTAIIDAAMTDVQAPGNPGVQYSSEVRPIEDGEPIIAVDVSTTITNGSFLTNINGWTDDDDSGATSAYATGNRMGLTGTIFNYARRYQTVTVAGGDQNVKHWLDIDVERGYINLQIGTANGDANYFQDTKLGVGSYLIGITPTGNFTIQVSSNTKYQTLVNNIDLYDPSSADDELGFFATGFFESPDDVQTLRYDQSGNVIYCAIGNSTPPKKIQRYTNNSWGLAEYRPDDGPFLNYNTTGITLSPSALSGDITLTASRALFKSTHADALFLIDSVGQKVSSTLSGEDQWSNSIRVTGTTRSFFATRASIGTNTVTLQRSIDGGSSWVDHASYTTNATATVNDGLDNQIVYYRIGIKTGDYTSGSPVVTLEYSQGSISGICRIVSVTNSTTAAAIVLREFGGTAATVDWREGAWSDYQGYPSATCLYEGRLWWFGKQFIDGSYSDAYETFDPDLEGAARPIRRSIGFGSADYINWAVGSKSLLIATDTRVLVARSSNNDYPLTQDDFTLKDLSSQGADNVSPIKVDSDVVYVQNSGMRLIRLAWDGAEYTAYDLTALSPEVGDPSIVRLAVQQQPDVRIHCVKSDGSAIAILFDPVEDRSAFIPIETDGEITGIFTLPGEGEDEVYYSVIRDIGDGLRYHEKFALESECEGGALNKQLDSFILYSGASVTTITGLEHLEGADVYVWSSGVVQGPFTVASGQITGLTTAVTSAVIGLTYRGRFKSVKIGQLMDKKCIPQVGLIMRNVHPQGIRMGQDFEHLVGIPKGDWRKTAGVPDSTLVIEDYHKETIPINSSWTMDSRLCLEMNAPYPCTLLAAVLNMELNEK